MQPRLRKDDVFGRKGFGFFPFLLLLGSLDDEGKRKKVDMADLQMRLGLGIRGSSAVGNGGRFMGWCLIVLEEDEGSLETGIVFLSEREKERDNGVVGRERHTHTARGKSVMDFSTWFSEIN